MHLIVTECRPQLVLVDAVRISARARLILDGLALPAGSLDLDFRVETFANSEHHLGHFPRFSKAVVTQLGLFELPIAS
jgi:hypothetical protein